MTPVAAALIAVNVFFPSTPEASVCVVPISRDLIGCNSRLTCSKWRPVAVGTAAAADVIFAASAALGAVITVVVVAGVLPLLLLLLLLSLLLVRLVAGVVAELSVVTLDEAVPGVVAANVVVVGEGAADTAWFVLGTKTLSMPWRMFLPAKMLYVCTSAGLPTSGVSRTSGCSSTFLE